jgi:plasmid replication initiation protein
MNKDSGNIKIQISRRMKPYLLFLKERYTQYELLYTLAMKSQYSIRLYELLKSYEYQRKRIFDIEELKLRLSAEHYKRFPDFKRKVLDRALEEINTLSDLDVTYTIIKESRRFAKIEFTMMVIKDINKRLKTWSNIEKIIGENDNVVVDLVDDFHEKTSTVDDLTVNFIKSLQSQIANLIAQNEDLRRQLNEERLHNREQSNKIILLAEQGQKIVENAQTLQAIENVKHRLTEEKKRGLFNIFSRRKNI